MQPDDLSGPGSGICTTLGRLPGLCYAFPLVVTAILIFGAMPAHTATYYMYYAGAGKKVSIGYATSTDLRHWTKHPGNPVIKDRTKCNDPFSYLEDGLYYLFFNDMQERVYYVTSTNLTSWSSESVLIGAVGEGNIVLKESAGGKTPPGLEERPRLPAATHDWKTGGY